MYSADSEDTAIRLAAFQAVKRLGEIRPHLTSNDLADGFEYQGSRVPFVNPQRGIFKPRRMAHLLSIRTVIPRSGARVWYDDQRDEHRQIYEAEESVEYAFMGQNPDAADNRWLKDAMEHQIPIIYFLGVAPGLYDAMVPTYIVDWDARALKAKIAFGLPGELGLHVAKEPERRYALRQVKQRLHQSVFREAVIAAYGGRCALSGLPEPLLLDAAHIVGDADDRLGQPVVPNGLTLSKIHHAAFDSHLIGVDPEFRIHVSDRLLGQNDGLLLEALKRMNLQKMHLPSRKVDWPDRDRLAARYEAFLTEGSET